MKSFSNQETRPALMEFQDQDFKTALSRALWMVLIMAALGIAITWVALGWRSAALFTIGAAISATGLLVWQRLMGAVLDRLGQGGKARPLATVLLWFFGHLLLSAGLLYVSLRGLDGSVYALIAGLGLALIALLVESLRLLKAWTF
jgi:hypothetical protein